MKERENHIDIAAGLMICWMILWHVLWVGNIDGLDYCPIFLFFMPWFFFKSGMYYRERSIKQQLHDSYRKLIIPYLVMMGISYLLVVLLALGNAEWFTFRNLIYLPIRRTFFYGALPNNGSLWFLFTLFLVLNISNIALRKLHPLVIAGVSGAAAWLLSEYGNTYIPDWVANTCSGLFFYCVGYLLREWQYNKVIVAAVAAVFILFAIIGLPTIDFQANRLNHGNYGIFLLCSLCGIIVLNNLCKLFKSVNRGVFSAIGRDAMNYYIIHGLLLCVTNAVVTRLTGWNGEWQNVVICLGSCMLFLPIINYMIKRITSKI